MKRITQPAKSSLRIRTAQEYPGAPRISIVVPTRDRHQLLARALRSALSQTFGDFEAIVVDDGSRSAVDLAAAGIDDARVRVIRQAQNGGVGAARNTGIAEARGELVAFLDDDDEWLPEKLAQQLARLAEVPDASAVYCLCSVQTGRELFPAKYQPPLPEGDVAASVLRDTHQLTPCAHVVKRAALLDVGGFDETFRAVGDSDLWLRLSQAGHRTVAVPRTLVVQHAEHKRRLTQDAALRSAGLARLDRRWRHLARALLGREQYEENRQGIRAELEPLHARHVKRLVRHGHRKKAWRYVRAMAPVLSSFPWATTYVARAIPVALLGEGATRLPGMPKRKTETPSQDSPATAGSPDD